MKYSECCDVPMYDDYDICTACGEHCDAMPEGIKL